MNNKSDNESTIQPPKFEVGMPVIAIADHPDGAFQKGDVFTVDGIRRGCSHHPVVIDIGKTGIETACRTCSHMDKGAAWYCARRFKPYGVTQALTVEQLIREVQLN